MKWIVLLVLLLPVVCYSQLVPEHVMPFGTYSSIWANDDFYTSARRDSMRQELGFNQYMSGGFSSNTINDFYADSLFPYPWATTDGDGDPQVQYARTTYYLTDPEPDSGQYYVTKFTNAAEGWQVSRNDTAYFAYSGSGLMLSNLKLGLPNKWDWFGQLQYSPYLSMAISPGVTDTNAIVGIFRAINLDYASDSVRFVDTLYVRDLPRGGSVFQPAHLQLRNDWQASNTFDSLFFTERNILYDNSGGTVRFQFQVAGACTVYVDYIKICDQYGARLIDSSFYDVDIKRATGRQGYANKIRGWFLKDTQAAGNFRPFAYINKLVKDTTAVWTHPVEANTWLNSYSPTLQYGHWADGFREFLKISNPKTLWVYLYPLWLNASYTGYDAGNWDIFQKALNAYIAEPCDSIRAAIASDTSISWVYTPQFWYCYPNDPVPEDTCSEEPRRKPTRAEMRCFAFMGLCYQPKSILIWKYESAGHGPRGIVDDAGLPRPGMYDAVKYDINPYIKAISRVVGSPHPTIS